MKKINDDVARALEKCADALSLNELSRVTGVRIELLRRYISRKSRNVREETWDKIAPVLKPYLTAPESEEVERPIRIGAPYRRHHDLVEMFSDQKILLDTFDALPDAQCAAELEKFLAAAGEGEPTAYESLSPEENRLMGAFLRLDKEKQQQLLLECVTLATAEMKKRRAELF